MNSYFAAWPKNSDLHQLGTFTSCDQELQYPTKISTSYVCEMIENEV